MPNGLFIETGPDTGAETEQAITTQTSTTGKYESRKKWNNQKFTGTETEQETMTQTTTGKYESRKNATIKKFTGTETEQETTTQLSKDRCGHR